MARGKRGRLARKEAFEDGGVAEGKGKEEAAETVEEDEALLSQCQSVLNLLMNQKHSWLFNEPVDPVSLEIPDYPTIIKHPMDLGTIKSKLEQREYTDLPHEFTHDVRLTFKNAMLYNPPGHEVHISAKKLLALFDKEEAKVLIKATTSPAPPPSTKQRPLLSVKAMSFEEKQKLLEDLVLLPIHMQHDAVALLMRENSSHVDWSSNEVHVQLDLMDDQTVTELDEHVQKCLKGVEGQGKRGMERNKAHGKGKKQKGKIREGEDEEDVVSVVIDVPLSMFPVATKAQ